MIPGFGLLGLSGWETGGKAGLENLREWKNLNLRFPAPLHALLFVLVIFCHCFICFNWHRQVPTWVRGCRYGHAQGTAQAKAETEVGTGVFIVEDASELSSSETVVLGRGRLGFACHYQQRFSWGASSRVGTGELLYRGQQMRGGGPSSLEEDY